VLLRDAASSGVEPSSPELGRRVRWAIAFGALIFIALIGRLWQLQVVRGDSYFQRTVTNVVHKRFLPSVRGKLLDRRGRPLADNRPAFNIYVTPKTLADSERAELGRLLGLSTEESDKVDQRIAAGAKRNSRQPVMILEDQGRDRAALIEQARFRMPGVEVRHEPYRSYPEGDLAAHLLGYMTQMTAAEAEQLTQQGYADDELVGRAGLEAKWENYLRGKKGTELYAEDARGQRLDEETTAGLIKGQRLDPPVPGANVVLTIDRDLQKLAERAIGRHAAAAVVVVEIKTGRVLALVSKPSFDPNIMTGHLTRAEETLLNSDPRLPFVDKTLHAQYPPGSTFKFVTTIAALEDGQAAEDEPIFCAGSYELAKTRFKCTAGHGKLDMIGAIQHSCNVYFWNLAERIGIDRLADVAREYGFGAPTNLGLNGDGAGRIPTKAWYEEHGRYMVGNATNAATGQGDVEVTVMQMAMAYTALANGGTLWVPQVVERVEAADGKLIKAFEPEVARQIKTPASVLDIWRRGMWKVVNELGGTAYEHARSDVVEIAAKTGTAEVKKRRKKEPDQREVDGWNPVASHAWFAGWAPANDPEIAIVVMIEHGGSGGKVAGPVARSIIEGYWTKVRGKAAPTPAPAPVAPAPAPVPPVPR
jgi:penicillin-binding protein 2